MEVLVSTMVLIQTAHATRVSSPNGKGTACRGGGDGICVSGATPLQNLLAMEALERRNLDRAAVSVEVLPLREHTHQIRITLQNLETVQIRLALVVK